MPVDSDERFRQNGFYRRPRRFARYSFRNRGRGGRRGAACVLRAGFPWATLFGSFERFHAVSLSLALAGGGPDAESQPRRI